jgi:hypothetical protein
MGRLNYLLHPYRVSHDVARLYHSRHHLHCREALRGDILRGHGDLCCQLYVPFPFALTRTDHSYWMLALLLSWPAENVSPQTKRATATAMQIFIGDIGGMMIYHALWERRLTDVIAIAGVLVYRPSLSAHFFRTSHIGQSFHLPLFLPSSYT